MRWLGLVDQCLRGRGVDSHSGRLERRDCAASVNEPLGGRGVSSNNGGSRLVDAELGGGLAASIVGPHILHPASDGQGRGANLATVKAGRVGKGCG